MVPLSSGDFPLYLGPLYQLDSSMKKNLFRLAWVLAATAFLSFSGNGTVGADELELSSAGPIAFGPEGLLLISDPMGATIYAVETGDTEGSAEDVTVEVEDVKSKVASMLGTEAANVRINDLAINPINGRPYLSVTRGSGKDASSLILTMDPESKKLSEFDCSDKKFTKAVLSNAAESKKTRWGNQRMQAITDMAFMDEKVYVAGLSNEEFASNLRSIPYPFEESDAGTSIEIFHGAHGKFETRSPIRTFAAFEENEDTTLLAAYTCAPLVRIPLGDLKPETKVRGTTIAELGNRNRPLDMVVYSKDQKNFALMANSHRGVMKIDLSTATTQEAITKRIGGTSGVPYETVEDLKGVMQLDGLNSTHAVVLMRGEDKKEHLKTIMLP